MQRELAYKDIGMKNLYAFADDTNGGFVIVAGDDCVEPVLAYSETDALNPYAMPVSMQIMLLGYEQQISKIRQGNTTMHKAGEVSQREAIYPLIETTWHQYLPLKYLTPIDETTGWNTPVGCVALTLAQLMYYYKYPKNTTITIPAYTTGTGYEMPALPPTTFDYSKMYINYDHIYEDDRDEVDPNDPSIVEVTKLLMYAGCAVQMNYSINGSAAVFDNDLIAKYFGYDKGARRLLAGNYPHDVWEEMMYNELAAGRPVPYEAGAVGNQRHIFIIDGYDGKGYFHANIGEIGRGAFNGFFKLGVLNYCQDQTSQVRFSGYNVSQAGILGFQPDKGNDAVPVVSVDYGDYLLSSTEFTRSSADADFKDVALKAEMTRYDSNGLAMDCGWGLFQYGLLKEVLYSTTTSEENISLNQKFNMDSKLADGTYQLFPIFRNHGAKEWEYYLEYRYTTEDGTPMRHYTATISEKKLHIGVSSTESNIKIDKVEYFAAYEGEKLNTRVWITNNGTNYENLLMQWIDGEWAAGAGTYIDPGCSGYIDLCAAAPEKGIHNVTFSTDWEGKEVIYSDKLNITDAPKYQLEADVTTKGLKGNVVYNELSVVCKITNTGTTTFDNMINAVMLVREIDEEGNELYCPETGYPTWVGSRVWYLNLKPGESTEIEYSIGKENLRPKNFYYDFRVLYYNNNSNGEYGWLYNSFFTYNEDEFINATSIVLNNKSVTMYLNEVDTLTATILPDNASDKSVKWTSSDESIVFVNNKGVLFAYKTGKAVITVTSVYNPEVTASCEVTVLRSVDYVELSEQSLLFNKIGETHQLTAIVMPEDASNKDVTWSSSDEAVCTVSQSGVVTSVGSGKATITVTSVDGGKMATCEVTVFVPVEAISLKFQTLQLIVGESKHLEATIQPDDATDKRVDWVSSDESILTVDKEGVVTAKKAGVAVITAASVSKPELRATCEVTVIQPAQSVVLSETSLSFDAIGDSYQLTATVLPADASNKAVTWSSSDEAVCTVSQSGLVTSVGSGKATITVTTVDGGMTATCEVTVFVPVEAISLNTSTLQLIVGESKRLEATIQPDDATDKRVDWVSSDESILTVDKEGVVTAKKAGVAVITAASVSKPELRATCEVTVIQPAQSVVLSETSLSFDAIGDSYQLTATVLPEDASNKAVTWSSSDEAVCTVSQSGLVTSVGSGKATITVTTVDGGMTATCEVTVVYDDGIFVLTTENMRKVRAIYDVTGRQVEELRQGINIILLNDGTTKKIRIK